MLKLVIEGTELFNDETQTFEEEIPDMVVELEHSLVSLSKWESKYQRPFLSSAKQMTAEEIFDYIGMMVLTENFDSKHLLRFTNSNIKDIQDYIDSRESATTFRPSPGRSGTGEIITAELIYYWLIAYNIPFECQYWHLNRLFALIRVCNVKNAPPSKRSKREIAQEYRDENMRRRAQLGTKG